VRTDQSDLNIVRIWDGPDSLGECPLWDDRRNRLFWIDCLGHTIMHANEDGSDFVSLEVSEIIGSIGLCEDGRLVAGLESGFAIIDPETKPVGIEWLGDPEPDAHDTRLNDGKVDRQGRFWCGTMNKEFTGSNAALYRLDADKTWTRADTGITVSNGIAFSPDGRLMYFSDSRVDRSFQYDLDPATGSISGRRTFIDTTTYAGRIDGATVDGDGNYWGALFQGGAIGCFSPNGDLLQKIEMPVSCPTMCSFGGPNMDILFVTSATFFMSQSDLVQEPQAGGLFAIKGLGVRGLLEPRFRMDEANK